jgi:aminopeptidase N
MAHRQKISTTIAPHSYAYLRRLIALGKATNMAEALDLALSRLRRAESRARLEQATAAYFQNLPSEAAREESNLATALDACANESDFDNPQESAA